MPAGTGPIAGLHRQEERLKRLPATNVLVLRPGYFFENFLARRSGLIRHQGINGGGAAGATTVSDDRDAGHRGVRGHARWRRATGPASRSRNCSARAT